MTTSSYPRLSKSRFVAGCQCPKLLWWTVHEPDAPELEPDAALQDLFDQGTEVGALAREQFSGGKLIDLPHNDPERVPATLAAIAEGAPAIFEATFVEDGVFVAVDVLLREGDGWALIEVKSSTKVKDEHISDAAAQTHVVRKAGLDVRRVEIMHLNPEFRAPDEGDLFVREDVTADVEAFLPQVPALVAGMREMLAGPLPDTAIGLHCFEPRECPFIARCWPDDRDHIRNLAGYGPKKTVSAMENGVHRIAELPRTTKLNKTQRRQVLAIERGELIVEPGLEQALEELQADRLGFLDFETVARAVPVWDGLGPWRAATVQFSYHERRGQAVTHHDFLADGPEDPRPALVERMLEATQHADKVLMYTSFERTRIKELTEQVPKFAGDLRALNAKLVDMQPLVKNYVYHPDFRGSFSIKYVLNPLVPSLSYDDLEVAEGTVASVAIARLLFAPDDVPDPDALRRALLAYCERDTWAMVKLVERLEELAG